MQKTVKSFLNCVIRDWCQRLEIGEIEIEIGVRLGIRVFFFTNTRIPSLTPISNTKPDTNLRFPEDLDFTISCQDHMQEDVLKKILKEVGEWVYEESGNQLRIKSTLSSILLKQCFAPSISQ